MKEITFSVPTGTFPAEEGDHVRVGLKEIEGIDMVDALVTEVETGCGTTDRVTLRYDDSLATLTACNLEGFIKLCEWCDTHICSEVFGPDVDVSEGDWHALFLPSPFRLDVVHVYSAGPTDNPIKFNILIGDTPLFPYDLTHDGEPLVASRFAFDSEFSDGELEGGTEIKISITEVPGIYDAPWQGLTLCVLGKWLP